MTRSAVPEKEILQRELKDDAPGWLWTISNLVVLAFSLALVGAVSWGVGRYARLAGRHEPCPNIPADPPGTEASRVPTGQV